MPLHQDICSHPSASPFLPGIPNGVSQTLSLELALTDKLT